MAMVATSLDKTITVVVATLVVVAEVLVVVASLRVVNTLAVVAVVVVNHKAKEVAARVAADDMPPTNGVGR